MPIPSDETSFITGIVIKIAGGFIAFISGVVTATWVVAGKIKGFDDRLLSVEKAQEKCQGQTLVNIDQKLGTIHRRIDDVLIAVMKENDK